MTNVLIVGATSASRYFLRQALGQPTVEVVGLVTRDPDELAYTFINDSAATRFRGTATREGDALVLAGRHGRGGLRHDRIPIHVSLDQAIEHAPPGDRQIDCVVLAENWPDIAQPPGIRIVRLGGDVPDPVRDVVIRIAETLETLSRVTHLFTSTVGAHNPGETERDGLLTSRAHRAGLSTRPADSVGTLATQVLTNPPERVLVTSVFVVFAEPVSPEAVRRRLRSASRKDLAESIQQETGPVGALDALGSSATLLDLSSVHSEGDSLAFALLTDPLASSTRLALAQVSGTARPSSWQGPVPPAPA